MFLVFLQLWRHRDMLSEGIGAGGQPKSHAAKADGRARLHPGSPDGLPPNSGQPWRCAVPETITYSETLFFVSLA